MKGAIQYYPSPAHAPRYQDDGLSDANLEQNMM